MTKSALIADIGGTNARFGIVDARGLSHLEYLECSQYASLADAVNAYLNKISDADITRPETGVFAVAGPASEDLVQITALPWSFSKSETARELGFTHFEVMNDFAGVALAIPPISPDLLDHLHGEAPRKGFAKGVLGPGTGLGVASLFPCNDGYNVAEGEGGHVTMPAKTQREFDIFQQLLTKYTHISAERVCSGKGLENLYHAIRTLDNRTDLPEYMAAPDISKRALSGTCDVSKECIDLMLAFLGRVAGNLALTLNAQGGIYIAGGIPTKLGDYFAKSSFLSEYKSKGRMTELMDKFPVFLVRHDAIALLGLEARAQQLISR